MGGDSIVWRLLAFIALSAGHAELWVTFVNRMYGLLIPIKTLHRIRGFHDVAIVAFPILVFWRVGFWGPWAFVTGQWGPLGLPWTIAFVVCSVGFLGLVVSVLTWWLRTRRCMWAGTVVEVTYLPSQPDAPREVDPSGVSLHISPTTRKLTRLPFNQQFELETTEKELVPPCWPDELDGLSILHLSDWHYCGTFSRAFYDAAARAAAKVRADLIAFTGDLCDELDCLDWLPSSLGTLAAPLGNWFILGNHDALTDHARVRRTFSELGWNDLGGKTQRLDVGPGRVVLSGDETPWLGKVPPCEVEDVILPRIVLAHTPDRFPYHAGQLASVVLAGHTHGGQIVLPVVGPVYAPSIFGCRYPSGVYSYAATAMHVSRGLAGMHPIRFGARPEITRLIIRSPKKLGRSVATHAEFLDHQPR